LGQDTNGRRGPLLPLRNSLQLFLFCVAFLIVATPARGDTQGLIYAGAAFQGDYAQRSERTPYAAALFAETEDNGQSRVNAQLEALLATAYTGDRPLLDGAVSVTDSSGLALSFAVAGESVESLRYGDQHLYVYRALASVLLFDFDRKILVANYPVMVQFQDLTAEPRNGRAHEGVFREIYLGTGERSLLTAWVERLNRVTIQETLPAYLALGSLTLEAPLKAALPDGVTEARYLTETAQLFESLLADLTGVSFVPYSTGEAVGRVMPLAFQDARVFQLTLPEPNFVFDVTLEPFKHLEQRSRGTVKHAFGAFADIRFSLQATGFKKTFLEARFRNINQLAFLEKDAVALDVWQSQQSTLRGLFVAFAKQLDRPDDKALKDLTKDDGVASMLAATAEKLAQCR
jgi:hypothetical protein